MQWWPHYLTSFLRSQCVPMSRRQHLSPRLCLLHELSSELWANVRVLPGKVVARCNVCSMFHWFIKLRPQWWFCSGIPVKLCLAETPPREWNESASWVTAAREAEWENTPGLASARLNHLNQTWPGIGMTCVETKDKWWHWKGWVSLASTAPRLEPKTERWKGDLFICWLSL